MYSNMLWVQEEREMIHGRHKAVGGAVVVPMRGFFSWKSPLFFDAPGGSCVAQDKWERRGGRGGDPSSRGEKEAAATPSPLAPLPF